MTFSIHNVCAREITYLLSNSPTSQHEEHVYDFAFFVETAIKRYFPILMEEYLKDFSRKLEVEFETYLNGEKIHHDDVQNAVAGILQRAIDGAGQSIKITL